MRVAASLAIAFAWICAVPALATESPCESGIPWYMTTNAASGESSVYLVLNSNTAVDVLVCYCSGPPDSYIWVRANDSMGTVARLLVNRPIVDKPLPGGMWVSELYQSSCMVAGGTGVWLANPNPEAVRGTFQIIK